MRLILKKCFLNHFNNKLRYFSTISKNNIITTNDNDVKWLNGLEKRSHFIEFDDHRLHLLQINKEGIISKDSPAVLLLHGAISNGLQFYSIKGQGLAPYLASKGMNVFIADLRGRGFSSPSIKDDPNSNIHGQTDSIRVQIPSFVDAVKNLSGRDKQTWISHSWGGVLLTSAVAYKPDLASIVDSQVCFGTKKTIYETLTIEYFKDILFGWNILCPIMIKIYGHIPKFMGLGSDGETSLSIHQSSRWISGPWIDYIDGFDYEKSHKELVLNNTINYPTFHICATNDRVLGHPNDVKKWAELTNQMQKFLVLNRDDNKEDYNHITMLTSKNCLDDHFPLVVEFINDNST